MPARRELMKMGRWEESPSGASDGVTAKIQTLVGRMPVRRSHRQDVSERSDDKCRCFDLARARAPLPLGRRSLFCPSLKRVETRSGLLLRTRARLSRLPAPPRARARLMPLRVRSLFPSRESSASGLRAVCLRAVRVHKVYNAWHVSFCWTGATGRF